MKSHFFLWSDTRKLYPQHPFEYLWGASSNPQSQNTLQHQKASSNMTEGWNIWLEEFKALTVRKGLLTSGAHQKMINFVPCVFFFSWSCKDSLTFNSIHLRIQCPLRLPEKRCWAPRALWGVCGRNSLTQWDSGPRASSEASAPQGLVCDLTVGDHLWLSPHSPSTHNRTDHCYILTDSNWFKLYVYCSWAWEPQVDLGFSRLNNPVDLKE